ncbi:hypothetical protein [Actinomadura sp. 6N118]|uniref:hypothetical protein n=1 Tax=Actinomadura sp. 6N118 TaxID=3375151 RepID=UPI0037B2CE64
MDQRDESIVASAVHQAATGFLQEAGRQGDLSVPNIRLLRKRGPRPSARKVHQWLVRGRVPKWRLWTGLAVALACTTGGSVAARDSNDPTTAAAAPSHHAPHALPAH